MSEPSLHTTQLRRWLERMRAGDRAARDELFAAVGGRMERLARKMLRRFPNVRRWVETGDVLQNATLRLLRSLEKLDPADTRAFFGLAATEMRRELLDLARHFYGPQGWGTNHPSHDQDEPPEEGDDPEELARWAAFHEEVERLPAEEREVVSLVFYHGWTQAEVAALFGVSERTVRRRWETALAKLHDVLAGGLED
jgi:RNA polymerase sigma-70 factor (ECF subfamily)